MTLSTSAVAVCCCSDFAQILGPLACTSSNSRDVLDGDHGLVGEGLQQLNVVVGESAGPTRVTAMNPTDVPLFINGANNMLP